MLTILRRSVPVLGTFVVAFVVAFWPLSSTPEGLALSLTAGATVAFVVLTHQSTAALKEQVSAARLQLVTSEVQLAAQKLESDQNDRRSRAALDAARESLAENVKMRLDASAPRVAITLRQPSATFHITPAADTSRGVSPRPEFVEADELDQFAVAIYVIVDVSNLGDAPAVVRNKDSLCGVIGDRNGEPMAATWLLPPRESRVVQWIYRGSLASATAIMGNSDFFGVRCEFEAEDILGQVKDTHTLEFGMGAVIRDGSRVRVASDGFAIATKGADRSDNGGLSRVAREYLAPPMAP